MRILSSFEPISLQETDRVRLLKRIDTKYIFHQNKLYNLLSMLPAHYRILEINGQHISNYETTYFDTADFVCYYAHHAGRLNRYKVRFRKYADVNTCFYEIKKKNNTGKSDKKRIPIEEKAIDGTEVKDFLQIHTPLKAKDLSPVLQNNFRRIALIDKQFTSRCTIDFMLSIHGNHRDITFDNLVVAEVKQEKFSLKNPLNAALKSLKVYPMSFSKYCMGALCTYPQLKHNRFKYKALKVKSIINTSTKL